MVNREILEKNRYVVIFHHYHQNYEKDIVNMRYEIKLEEENLQIVFYGSVEKDKFELDILIDTISSSLFDDREGPLIYSDLYYGDKPLSHFKDDYTELTSVYDDIVNLYENLDIDLIKVNHMIVGEINIEREYTLSELECFKKS